MEKIFLGLPAYNEKDSIYPLFQKIHSLVTNSNIALEVILYDDGCQDGTKSEVNKWNEKIVIHYLDGITNKGLGTAINSIITNFLNIANESDFLVIMDCDDTHDPAQIPHMISTQQTHPNANIVIASRYRKGASINGVPFHRVFMSMCAAMLYKCVHPFKEVRDYTCGYRLYTYNILQKATTRFSPLLREKGFACMVELLLRLKAVGGKSTEIPLLLSYDNKRSESKMDVSGNAFRLLKKLIDWRIRGLST